MTEPTYRVEEPLRLYRQPAFWLFWALVSGCAIVTLSAQARYFAAYPGAWLLSVILLATIAVPAGAILYKLDEFEREPASLIAIAVIWGGVVAVTFAGIVNGEMYGFLQHVIPARTVDAWAASLTAPINEELYKGLGLVLIFLMARREIDDVMDGLIYGAMIGLGFQVMENIQYFMLAASRQGGAASAVVDIFFLRVVLSGLYSHMLFSGFFGFGFAYFVTQRARSLGRRVTVFMGCVLLSWAAHFIWNSPLLDRLADNGQGAFVSVLVIKGLPFLLLLLLLLIFAERREKRVFGCLLSAEIGGPAVSEEEYEVLRSGLKRRRAIRSVGRTKGPGAKALYRLLVKEQIKLALVHSRVQSADHPALDAQRDVIKSLKARLASMPVRG